MRRSFITLYRPAICFYYSMFSYNETSYQRSNNPTSHAENYPLASSWDATEVAANPNRYLQPGQILLLIPFQYLTSV
jgi:hypothetical protein